MRAQLFVLPSVHICHLPWTAPSAFNQHLAAQIDPALLSVYVRYLYTRHHLQIASLPAGEQYELGL